MVLQKCILRSITGWRFEWSRSEWKEGSLHWRIECHTCCGRRGYSDRGRHCAYTVYAGPRHRQGQQWGSENWYELLLYCNSLKILNYVFQIYLLVGIFWYFLKGSTQFKLSNCESELPLMFLCAKFEQYHRNLFAMTIAWCECNLMLMLISSNLQPNIWHLCSPLGVECGSVWCGLWELNVS